MAGVDGDWNVGGECRANTLHADNGIHGVSNFHSTSGRRKANSLIVPRFVEYRFADGADVATLDIVLCGILQSAELVEVQIIPEVAPNGGDKKYTVDIHKGNTATAYATVLSAAFEVSVAGTAANRKAQYASIDSTKKDFARGDSAKLVVTASGSTGNQGQGGGVVLKFYEHGAS